MEKQDIPFRFFFIVMSSILIFACLIKLNSQSPNGVLHWLTTIAICAGVPWLFALAAIIYYDIVDRKMRRYQAQEPERLKKHQARFYCHICGKPSPQPYRYWVDGAGEGGRQYSEGYYLIDYNRPTGLVQCAQCKKWTCDNADPPHLENGVCKKCLENTPKQV